MKMREDRCGIVPARAIAAVLGTVAIMAGGLALPAVAGAATPFTGSYTAVRQSSTVDPHTGAPNPAPDQVNTWIVSSSCALTACIAHVATAREGFDMLFDGQQWNRLAVPHTGTCNGATVPARSAAWYLVPQSDGSFSGAVTSTVDCNGAPVNLSQPLTLTPA